MMNKPAMLSLLLAPAALFADPSVERVIVRQQWPWSTDVKVEYSLSGVDANNPVDISVRAFNGETELPSENLYAAITGDRCGVTDAVGSFIIDPIAAFGTSQVALGNFSVQLTVAASAANMNDVIYKIVDCKSPYGVTNVTRKALLNGKWGKIATSFSQIDSTFTTSLDDVLIWLDVTNDVYKTDKMVFRRIPAAGKSFQFQKGIAAATNAYYGAGEGIKVSFMHDYYIGVFELTQQQFHNLTTSFNWDTRFYLTNNTYRAMRPADKLRLNHPYADYPSAAGSNNGGATTIMRSKTKLDVKLPTEAMWEYACRAGTDTFKYSGATGTCASDDGDFSKKTTRAGNINGNASNAPDRNCDLSWGTLQVGSLKPNAFGLYDMLGNVREWCSDRSIGIANFWKCACYAGEDNVDPTGPASGESGGTNRFIIRGGSYAASPLSNGSMGREDDANNYDTARNGVRLCIFLNTYEEGVMP